MLSLVLGILSFVCMAVGYFVQTPNLSLLIWAGVALGVVAWITGAKAAKADPADSKAKIGKILGIIATIVGILLLIFAVFITGMIVSNFAAA